MDSGNGKAFEGWAIVELMGHVRIVGMVTEEEHFGVKLGRVDVPQADGTTAAQFFGGGSIYRVTPISEAEARDDIERRRRPVFGYLGPSRGTSVVESLLGSQEPREHFEDDQDPEVFDEHDEDEPGDWSDDEQEAATPDDDDDWPIEVLIDGRSGADEADDEDADGTPAEHVED